MGKWYVLLSIVVVVVVVVVVGRRFGLVLLG
jgi:hypothetical protein